MATIHREFELAASAAQCASIEAVGSVEEVCARASTVVVSVAGEPAERAVFLGERGLVARSAEGSLLIGCGTVTVELAREANAAMRENRLSRGSTRGSSRVGLSTRGSGRDLDSRHSNRAH